MPKTISELLGNYISAVQNIYGEHLKKIVLYGSYARGDFTNDSDVDIMLLVDLPEDELDTFSDQLSELGFEHNVNHGIWFMPVVKNEGHFRYWCEAYPFYNNVAKEGISLYETA